jgi:hypothetical protein
MWKSFMAAIALAGAAAPAFAATAVNNDKEPHTLMVTEGAGKSALALAGGETAEFCANGCFVTLPNGDLEVLTGSETVVITNGVARIQ